MSDLRTLVLAEDPTQVDELDESEDDDDPTYVFVVVDPAGADAVLRLRPYGDDSRLHGWRCSVMLAGGASAGEYTVAVSDVELGHDENDSAPVRSAAQRALALWDAARATGGHG